MKAGSTNDILLAGIAVTLAIFSVPFGLLCFAVGLALS